MTPIYHCKSTDGHALVRSYTMMFSDCVAKGFSNFAPFYTENLLQQTIEETNKGLKGIREA